MGDAYLNKKPIADDFEYVYAEFDGVIIRIPKEKVVAFAEAGGYYQPNVDEEGNLTWTASKEGMPAAETVNIKGPKGDDGTDGKDGADGEPGKDGADGATPYIGDNGNWFIGDTDTGKPSRGEKGLDANVTVDAELSEKSTNPVQNAAVAKELSKLSNEIDEQQRSINALARNDIDAEYYMTVKNHSVTPEMFGAIGDGIADDTNALKQCLLQDKPVYLSGNYKITEDLYITRTNFAMFGKTGGYSATSPTLHFQNASLRINSTIMNVRMRGFAIRSNTIGLLVDGEERTGGHVFEDLQFVCNKCVKLDVESGYIWFINCFFGTFVEGSETDDCLVDLRYTGNSSNRLNYVYFDRCAFEGGSIPDNLNKGVLIKLGNCAAINITNCDLCNCARMIDVDTSKGSSQWIKITNNYIWTIGLVINMSAVNDSLVANNCINNRSGQPIIISDDFRSNAVVGNIFTYWTQPLSTKGGAGNVFSGNLINAKSHSLEGITDRSELIHVPKTHRIFLGAGESVTKTLNMRICYVDTLYITCSDSDITYTTELVGNNFNVTLTNSTAEDKEFLMFVH